jgi:hypothetical protein
MALVLGTGLVGSACLAAPSGSHPAPVSRSPSPTTAASSHDIGSRPPSVRVADCQAAFANLPGEMQRIPRLDVAGPEVDGTFVACGDVETWITEAERTFPLAAPTLREARVLLALRCADSVTLREFAGCAVDG